MEQLKGSPPGASDSSLTDFVEYVVPYTPYSTASRPDFVPTCVIQGVERARRGAQAAVVPRGVRAGALEWPQSWMSFVAALALCDVPMFESIISKLASLVCCG